MPVCLVGLGKSVIAPALPEKNFRELIFDAVTAALADAGLKASDLESALTASDDFVEGRSIADEFTSDVLAAKLKPNDRICGDSLVALLNGVMQIEAGIFDVVLVGGYEKSSEAQIDRLDAMALDPMFDQPVCPAAELLAGMEITSFLHNTGLGREVPAQIAAKNSAAGAPYGTPVDAAAVIHAKAIVDRIGIYEKAAFADGAVAVILTSESKAKEIARTTGRPYITLTGYGFNGGQSWNGSRDFGAFPHLAAAGQKAYDTAGIDDPQTAFDLVELDDRYAHREAMAACELGLTDAAHLGDELAAGRFNPDGALPINISGGRLGSGDLFTGAGLRAVVETGLALRAAYGEPNTDGFTAGQLAWLGAKDRQGKPARALIATLFGPMATTGAACVLQSGAQPGK
jgi:acetyl-CoA C-acetyltransferase